MSDEIPIGAIVRKKEGSGASYEVIRYMPGPFERLAILRSLDSPTGWTHGCVERRLRVVTLPST